MVDERPGGGGHSYCDIQQTVAAEKYVISHHLGDVISQSWATTEQAMGSAAIRSLRGAYTAAKAAHVTVLAASGDSGATDLKGDLKNYYTYPVTGWPATDPLVTAV